MEADFVDNDVKSLYQSKSRYLGRGVQSWAKLKLSYISEFDRAIFTLGAFTLVHHLDN